MKLDLTPLGHAICVNIIQLFGFILFGDVLISGVIGATFFIAREHTQAEYRWIIKYGLGKRINMPWYGGLSYKVWDTGSILDFLVPSASSLMVILYLH